MNLGVEWDEMKKEKENKTWAKACDFNSTFLSQIESKGEDCNTFCRKNSNCSHYTWIAYKENNFTNGTCIMKSGDVTESDAFFTGPNNENKTSCGIVREYLPPPSPGNNFILIVLSNYFSFN